MNHRRWGNLWFPGILSAVALMGLLSACSITGQGANGSSTMEAAPAFAAAIVDREVIIYDNSGAELGDGTVNLYAPTSMRLFEIAKIRLEITGIVAEIAGASTPGPDAPSTLPTRTPLASETLSIHEIMGATLQGVDTNHFTVNAVPANGQRTVNANGVTRWEWTLRPIGAQAAGTNYLEVLVYYPRTAEDGTRFDEEIAIFEVNIDVEGPPTPTPGPPPGPIEQLNKSLGPVAGIAGAITAIAGAVGVLYGAYRFITRRSKRKRKP